METKDLEFAVNTDWAEAARNNPWLVFVPEFAKDADGQEYMRKRGSSVVYKIVKDGADTFECKCAGCDSEIKSANVAHPIWDGLFPCSGGGEVKYEGVPYCPKCEKEPNFNGSPITVK